MRTHRLDPAPLDRVIEFVNEYADAPRTNAGEDQQPYPPLDDWPDAEGRPLTELVTVANKLFAVFAQSPADSATAMNELLAKTGAAPRIGIDEFGNVELTWSRKAGADPLLASCALAVLLAQVDSGLRRLGVCAASRCVDVFVDSSPARARRYCSTTCLNRTKVAEHRARQRARIGSP